MIPGAPPPQYTGRKEKLHEPSSGTCCFSLCLISVFTFLTGIVLIATSAASPYPKIAGVVAGAILAFLSCCTVCWSSKGLYVVNPNQATLLVMFNQYVGTVKGNGLFWVNPFYDKMVIDLKSNVHHSANIVVNDKGGNPIEIGVVLVWKIDDTFRATYDV